jgi:hypothetical protein
MARRYITQPNVLVCQRIKIQNKANRSLFELSLADVEPIMAVVAKVVVAVSKNTMSA